MAMELIAVFAQRLTDLERVMGFEPTLEAWKDDRLMTKAGTYESDCYAGNIRFCAVVFNCGTGQMRPQLHGPL